MKTRTLYAFIGALILSLSLGSNAEARGGGKRLVLNVVGTATGRPVNNDLVGNALCFDLELINAKNRRHVGTATDCLREITGDGDGVALKATTFFRLRRGTLVVRGNTSVKPVDSVDVATPFLSKVTHMTGASALDNAIVATGPRTSTKRFKRASGTARLSGMVDLSNFNPTHPTNPTFDIGFDCVFVIDLD